jgi:hypothetical protein
VRELHESARRLLDSSAEERCRSVREPRWIGYTAAKSILTKLEELLNHPKTHRMPNLLIFGKTNNGKTALVNRFYQLSGLDNDPHRDAIALPVLLIQAPPTPDERRFITSVLDGLGIIHGRHDRFEQMDNQIRIMLPKLGVRMMIIDEIHNILSGSGKSRERFLNVIRNIGNDLQIPIVAVGTELAVNAIESDAQLKSRFELAPLPRWDYGKHYRQLVASFEALLPLRKPSELSEPRMSFRLYNMTDQTIGGTATLVSKAAIEAIRGGDERITDEVLNRLDWIPPSERRREAMSVI